LLLKYFIYLSSLIRQRRQTPQAIIFISTCCEKGLGEAMLSEQVVVFAVQAPLRALYPEFSLP
jgi:hypothetical protein